MAMSRHTLAACKTSGDAQLYSGLGEPWSPARLVYTVFPRGRLIEISDILKSIGEDSSRYENRMADAWSDEDVHAIIDVSATVEAKWDAVKCHRTQQGIFSKNLGSFSYGIAWVWMVIYAAVPIIMTVLLILQKRKPGGDPEKGAVMPQWFRLLLICQAIVMLALGPALLIAPQTVAPTVWPWALSALTGRAVGAWLVGFGVAAAHAAWENDFRRVRGAMVAYCLLGLAQIIALARYATAINPKTGTAVLDWGDPRLWIYLGFIISLALVGLYGWTAFRRSTSTSANAAMSLLIGNVQF